MRRKDHTGNEEIMTELQFPSITISQELFKSNVNIYTEITTYNGSIGCSATFPQLQELYSVKEIEK